MLETIVLGVALFAATNIDDLFLLLVYFADGRTRTSAIVLGQLLGIGALVAASLAAALLALVVPARWLGLLGLVPIALGLREAFDRDGHEEDAPRGHLAGTLAVASLTIANGGDNVGVYTPVFATRAPLAIAALVGVFAVMTALWIAGARWLVAHPTLGPPIRRFARPLVPWVLVAVGVYVLIDAGTFA